MYTSEYGSWDAERAKIAARNAEKKRRAARRAEIDEMPHLSQRLIGRILFAFTR